MSVDSDLAVPLPKSPVPKRNLTPLMWLGIVSIGIAVVSLVRIWTGANNLDSSGAIQAAITAARPSKRSA